MVRTPNLGTVLQYVPATPPENPDEFQRYLSDEFRRIAVAIRGLADGHLDKSYSAPPKPRDGDIRYADGSTWAAGSGYGLYLYNGSAWKLIGGGGRNTFDEMSPPGTPASGTVTLYAKTDGLLYSKDDAGQEDRVSGIQEAIIDATRDSSASNGNVSYTGVGFKPRTVEVLASIDGGLATVGFFNASSAMCLSQYNTTAWYTLPSSVLIYTAVAGSDYAYFSCNSMDSDGFTLAWTKSGSPTGTIKLKFRCIR